MSSASLRAELPYDAAFATSAAFRAYRRRRGIRPSPLPHFYIGAHALVHGHRLRSRDASRYSTYFPAVSLVTP